MSLTKLLRFISEEESDGSTGNTLVDEVFSDFLKFSSSGIRALEISAMFIFQISRVSGKETESMASKEKQRAFMRY